MPLSFAVCISMRTGIRSSGPMTREQFHSTNRSRCLVLIPFHTCVINIGKQRHENISHFHSSLLHDVPPLLLCRSPRDNTGAPGRTVLRTDGVLLGKYDIIKK